MIRNLQEGPNPVNVQETAFSLDNMGRFLCNTLQEARDSAGVQVASKQRDFDTIVIGGGTFGAAIAASLLFADSTHSRRILVLEAGPFALPEHNQNMPYKGATPVELFIDARHARAATIDVSGAWARWLGARRAQLRHVSMLTGSRFIQLSAQMVRRSSRSMSFPAAVAAPNTPQVEVMCQPLA